MAKSMLVNRSLTNFIAAFGICQLFFATALAVCGFVALGIFKNTVSVGIWSGLPMMVPAILCVILVATRHRATGLSIFVCGVAVLAASAYHAYYVYEEIEFWEDYSKYAATTNALGIKSCYNRGDHCVCDNAQKYLDSGYTVQFCDQFRLGEELFWTMFILTLIGLFFTLLTTILSLISICACTAKEYEEPEAPAYDENGKSNFAYNH